MPPKPIEATASVRIASLAVQFGSDPRPSVPKRLADWDVDLESAAASNWTIAYGLEPSPQFRIDSAKREAHIGRVGGRGALSYPAALFELLIHHDVLPIHAAAFAVRGHAATLVSAPSGGGKSSLSWLAASHGRGLISDDHIGLRRSPKGLELIPLKRSVAVDPALLASRPEFSTEEPMEAGTKLRFDPQTAIENCRVYACPPGRIVFLERGAARHIAPLSPSEAFARLIPQSAGLKPSARRLLPLLRDLADSVPASVATLTRSCLEDPRVLDELGA